MVSIQIQQVIFINIWGHRANALCPFSVIKFLRKLNNVIDGIELVNGYYLDKYCEENGFYELYDDRLKHNYEIFEDVLAPIK